MEKFTHQPRLYALTRQIGAGLDYDDDVVFAAVWLHDIGVFVGHRPEDPAALAGWDMVGYALKVVPGILQSAGFPEEKIPAVLEVIRTHQPGDEPATIEGTIHRDADILELLGAAGILRTAIKIGRDTRFQTFADALNVLRRHVETLPSRLKLARSKELAAPRLHVLREFLQHAGEEGVE
ncbi:MAG: phosphohydrolase [Verrucomicrobia bacterium]|nr:phosphohydrolase [Verrucomicrobiota bacterium]